MPETAGYIFIARLFTYLVCLSATYCNGFTCNLIFSFFFCFLVFLNCNVFSCSWYPEEVRPCLTKYLFNIGIEIYLLFSAVHSQLFFLVHLVRIFYQFYGMVYLA